MHARKPWKDRSIYPTDNPYPLRWDVREPDYSPSYHTENQKNRDNDARKNDDLSLIGDPSSPDDFPSSFRSPPDDKNNFRPLKLLNSLFSDRLNLLQRSLEELETAKKERHSLTQEALKDIDSDIQECERYLSTLHGLTHDPEQQRHLHHRLLELKRDRRREKLLSFRDVLTLQQSILNLKRQIEALGRTANPTGKREAPG